MSLTIDHAVTLCQASLCGGRTSPLCFVLPHLASTSAVFTLFQSHCPLPEPQPTLTPPRLLRAPESGQSALIVPDTWGYYLLDEKINQ